MLQSPSFFSAQPRRVPSLTNRRLAAAVDPVIQFILLVDRRNDELRGLSMIIWQGRGGLTALFIILSMAGVIGLINLTAWHGPDWITYFAMALPAAAANAILAAKTPSEERVVLDKQTGQEIVLRQRHTLFWIPIKYWTFIILAYPVIGTLRDMGF
jgi:hypothetical protein